MSAKKIGDIKEQLKSITDSQLAQFIEAYGSDERGGVIKLVDSAKKRLDKYEKELIRTEGLKKYEREYASYAHICGIDEVGRGPLAGPVVACAAHTAAKRDELYDVIMEKAVSVGIGMASHERIDEINILQATYEAMRQAIGKLDPAPDLTLNDAVTIPGVDIKQVPIIKGDAKSISIGAASIVAKVTRDRMMVEYDRIYPGYGFASNKGYGSAEHIKALKEIGPSPIHRASFIHNFI